MRLSVDGGGYTTAADAFSDANQMAALLHDSLAGKLAGFGRMAGDDATSAEFAAAYDETATESVGALGDLVDAFASLGRLTTQSLANHREAEARSVTAGRVVFDGSAVPTGSYVSVLSVSPPSALGGDSPHFSGEVAWILDRIQGFVWPNADTSLLRDAAQVWRTAADDVDRLTTHCDAAASGLDGQRSPEVPIALAAIADVAGTVRELSGHCAAVAESCETYAAQVDAKREEILALVREILEMVVEGVLISVAIGLITAGAGALVGGGSVAARVAAQSPRFAAVLGSLRMLSAASAARLRGVHAGVRATRARLERFLRVPVRNEIGSFSIAGGHRWRTGWLSAHEHSGSHTIARHVGKTPNELKQRLRSEPLLRKSSSFSDQDTAERVIEDLLRRQRARIEEWISHGRGQLAVEGTMRYPTGITAEANGAVREVASVRAVLRHDPSMPQGFRIYTAFPRP